MAAAQGSQSTLDFCHDEHSTALLQGLQELRSENLLVDVVFCVSGKEIPCHRNVLAACSGYFRAMFCNGHRESKEHRITIHQGNASTLQLLVDYAYTSRVTITEDNAVELMEGASFFQVPPVRDACTKFLSDTLSVKNCLEMVKVGGMLNPTLEAKALSYAIDRFTAVNKTPEFLELTKDQLIKLISSDDLNAPEETVYEAVMKWINHDTRKRKKEMKELMELIRFPFMDKMYFIQKVQTDNTLRKCCQDLMSETLMYQAFPGEVQSPRTRPRRASGLREAVVIVGLGGMEKAEDGEEDGSEEFESHSIIITHAGESFGAPWVPMTIMKGEDDDGFAVAVLGTSDIMVSVGGNHSKDVWLYQVNLDSWSKLARMKKARSDHKLAVVQGKVYAIGGRLNLAYVTPSVEVYDRHQNSWTVLRVRLPQPRYRHAVAVLDDSIYVIGGRDADSETTSTVYYFSPGDIQWHSAKNMPEKAADITATVLNGGIYVAGLPNVLCYKPQEELWTVVANTATGLRCGMTVFGGEIYIYGGIYDNDMDIDPKVLWLDLEDKSLKLVGCMPRGLFGYNCVTILKSCDRPCWYNFYN